MRLLDKTILTEDEEYRPESRISQLIRDDLEKVLTDLYNEQYVVRITVDRVDSEPNTTGGDLDDE